ncbi:helix-turn-helix transcriptional regulator [Rhodococcus koreensis]
MQVRNGVATLHRSPLLTEREAAVRLGVHPGTLAKWRCQGEGPTYFKMGNRPKSPVRYEEDDLHTWMEQQRRGGDVA